MELYMVTGAISAYTSIESDIFLQVVYIAATLFIVAFPCVGIWLVFGVGLKKHLKSARHQKIFNWSMAILLVGSIWPIAYELFLKYVV